MHPYVFILDFDGTIIGNISPQVCEWEILSKLAPGKMKQFKDNLRSQLEQGLLRPYFSMFLDYMSHNFPNVEVFIYTASDVKWANVAISTVEQLYGIKFNRPLFTRTHCIKKNGEFRKSFDNIIPLIFNKLRQKYDTDINYIRQNIVMIDNFHDVLIHDDKRLIKCPTYNHVIYYDVLRLIDESLIRSHYIEISKILNDYKLFPTIPTSSPFSYEVFKALYFTELSGNIKSSIKLNSKHDTMWNILISAFSKIDHHPFKDSSIRYINQKLL